MDLSVVIPAWNEAGNLSKLLPQLHSTLQTLGCDRGRVIRSDARSFLAGAAEPFDIIFLDPPFGESVLADVCLRIEAEVNLRESIAGPLPCLVGINLLQGSENEHNLRDICPSGGYDCLGDPTTWNAGNWQLINYEFKKYAMAPWFSKASFADNMMEKRDEVWAGVTYQF